MRLFKKKDKTKKNRVNIFKKIFKKKSSFEKLQNKKHKKIKLFKGKKKSKDEDFYPKETKKSLATRRLLTVSVVLIFLIFATYNMSTWLIHKNYTKTSDLNDDILSVMETLDPNSAEYKKLSEINSEIMFINAFCFNGDIPDKITTDGIKGENEPSNWFEGILWWNK